VLELNQTCQGSQAHGKRPRWQKVGVCKYCKKEGPLHCLWAQACRQCDYLHVRARQKGACVNCRRGPLVITSKGLCSTCYQAGAQGQRVRRGRDFTPRQLAAAKEQERVFLDRYVPALEEHARLGHRRFTPQRRDELLEEARAMLWFDFVRVVGQGQEHTPLLVGVLVKRAMQKARGGRTVLGMAQPKDALSPLCHWRHGLKLSALMQDALLPGRRQEAIPDSVAARLDTQAWADTLEGRQRELLDLLVAGKTTAEVATSMGVTRKTAKKLRSQLCRDWQDSIAE
jgi:hypothetical protein